MEDVEAQTSQVHDLVDKLKTVEFNADGSNFKEVRIASI